jgi:ABC-type phosphate transport system substrate-binding protein
MKVRVFGLVCCILTLLVASSRMAVSTASDSAARGASAVTVEPTRAGDVAIIVNPRNPERNISFDTLRRYFKAESGQWPNGAKVVVAMRQPAGQPERVAILRSIYGWDENYYQKYFSQRPAPKELNTTYAMIQFVYYTPGAIGYVRAGEVDASKVKVLSVDGSKPGDKGYRIR